MFKKLQAACPVTKKMLKTFENHMSPGLYGEI